MGLTAQDLQKMWSECYIENFIPEMLGILEHVESLDPLKTIVEKEIRLAPVKDTSHYFSSLGA